MIFLYGKPIIDFPLAESRYVKKMQFLQINDKRPCNICHYKYSPVIDAMYFLRVIKEWRAILTLGNDFHTKHQYLFCLSAHQHYFLANSREIEWPVTEESPPKMNSATTLEFINHCLTFVESQRLKPQQIGANLNRFVASEPDCDADTVVIFTISFIGCDFGFKLIRIAGINHRGNLCIFRAWNIAEDKVEIEVFHISVIIIGKSHSNGILVVLVFSIADKSYFCALTKFIPQFIIFFKMKR